MFQKKIVCLVIAVFLLVSCNNGVKKKSYSVSTTKAGGLGMIQFAYDKSSVPENQNLFSIMPELIKSSSVENARKIIISVADEIGKPIYFEKELNLHKLGASNSFISEPAFFSPGSYKLIGYQVVDESGDVIMATPLEGSKFAHLVDDPLAIDFTVEKGKTSKITPQVADTLETGHNNPEDFGYSTFSFDLVKTFHFQAGFFAYDESSDNLELTGASIRVKNGTETLYTGTLRTAPDQIYLRDDYELYEVTVSKNGYQDYSETFTADELKEYKSSPLMAALYVEGAISLTGLVGE